jgi:hypothetical protein
MVTIFLDVGIGLWKWKSNLIDENTKEKMTRKAVDISVVQES